MATTIIFFVVTANAFAHQQKTHQWCHWVTDSPEYAPAPMSQVIKDRLNLLNLFKAANIDYVLMYGTLLGSVRHNGFIPADTDMDIRVLPPLDNDPRFSNVTSRHDFRIVLANILSKFVQNTSLNFSDILIVKNPYPCGEATKVEGVDHQILFTDPKFADPDFDIWEGYLMSLSFRKSPVEYDFMGCGYLDVHNGRMVDIVYDSYNAKLEYFIERKGPLCRCKLHDTEQLCHEFDHLTLLEEFGETYMIPLNWTGGYNDRAYGKGLNPTRKSMSVIQKEKELFLEFQKSKGGIKITNKDGISKWWYAVTLSNIPNGVEIEWIKAKGRGQSEWELGVLKYSHYTFTNNTPYSAPFDFKIKTRCAGYESVTSYGIIQSLSEGESASISPYISPYASPPKVIDDMPEWNLISRSVLLFFCACFCGVVVGIKLHSKSKKLKI